MLRKFVCVRCGEIEYVFEAEVEERLGKSNCGEDSISRYGHVFEKMPPIPEIVHCTNRFMHIPLLDSWFTRRQLDKQLTEEAANLREAKSYQDFVTKN